MPTPSITSQRSAFTLIELLIVVAIIAILAAIAVPNFLEAQTRARLARANADMRTIATALETYNIDYSAYPDITVVFDFEQKLVPLTTPIAYLTSVPGSAFTGWLSFGATKPTQVYYYQNKTATDFIDNEYGAGPIPTWLMFDPEGTHEWYLSAVGPDGDYDQLWDYTPGGNRQFYDPTNGTSSDGDVIRLGP